MNTEWTKRILIIILCGICTLVTYFFHGILKVSTVFTHFYYIPIILSAIWWQRKGLIITIILCLTLLLGHLTDIFADTTQIQMILTAIVKNAMEATQEKGTIIIRTHPEKIDSKTSVMDSGMIPGEYIRLEVEDTGSGMSAEILEYIFEPFYTKKVMGRAKESFILQSRITQLPQTRCAATNPG